MPSININVQGWLQIISNFAIIAGLIIVIYELNQNKQLAYAQMFTDGAISGLNRNIAIMGEDPRIALVKAALRPQELTEEDAVTLDAFYRSWTNTWVMLARSEEIANLDRPWRESVAGQARGNFTSGPGRRWLKNWASSWASDEPRWAIYREVASIALAAVDDDSNAFQASFEAILDSRR